jgi:hypothetical protein
MMVALLLASRPLEATIFASLTEKRQQRFLKQRHNHFSRQAEFLKQLRSRDKESL